MIATFEKYLVKEVVKKIKSTKGIIPCEHVLQRLKYCHGGGGREETISEDIIFCLLNFFRLHVTFLKLLDMARTTKWMLNRQAPKKSQVSVGCQNIWEILGYVWMKGFGTNSQWEIFSTFDQFNISFSPSSSKTLLFQEQHVVSVCLSKTLSPSVSFSPPFLQQFTLW